MTAFTHHNSCMSKSALTTCIAAVPPQPAAESVLKGSCNSGVVISKDAMNLQACTPTPPPQRQSTPLAVARVRQEAEVAAVWAGQLAGALQMNQDLEDSVVSLRQHIANLKR